MTVELVEAIGMWIVSPVCVAIVICFVIKEACK